MFLFTIKSKKNKLPIKLTGTRFLRPISFVEKKGSAQVKSCILLAALNTFGETVIKCKKSRNHTELLCKHLNLPVKVKNKKKTVNDRILNCIQVSR